MNSLVSFKIGSYAEYVAATKDEDILYFTTDTYQLFKGSSEYTKSAVVLQSLPQISSGIYGVVYLIGNSNDGYVPYIFNGQFVKMVKDYVTSISSASTDSQIPTAKAVYDKVKNDVTDASFSSSRSTVDGQTIQNAYMNFYKDGTAVISKQVSLLGIAMNPSYVSATRTITIPIVGGPDLVINLGVNAFVESGVYNSETKNIELTLTNGEVVYIPAEDMVHEYTGGTTSSSTVTVPNGVITVSVKLSATAGNNLVLNEDGLYVGSSNPVWETIS